MQDVKVNGPCRYFIAEGLACGQSVHWASAAAAPADPLEGLPQLLEPSSNTSVRSSALQ